MKIAIQGIEGSFHEEAAHKLVPSSSIKIIPCATFQQVFKEVEAGTCNAGVVAIENSLHGSINAVYRLLDRYNLWICGETTLEIEQYLIANHPMQISEIQGSNVRVLSQAPALSQVEQWLDANLPNAIRQETGDTAESVRLITNQPGGTNVAIAGKHAAKLYGGTIIAGPINDDPNNYTRFVMLTKKPCQMHDTNRTSIILKTDHQPGALLNALQIFAAENINLSKLDSHPIPGDARHYAFYIDYEAGLDSVASRSAISALKKYNCKVKVLGSYRV